MALSSKKSKKSTGRRSPRNGSDLPPHPPGAVADAGPEAVLTMPLSPLVRLVYTVRAHRRGIGIAVAILVSVGLAGLAVQRYRSSKSDLALKLDAAGEHTLISDENKRFRFLLPGHWRISAREPVDVTLVSESGRERLFLAVRDAKEGDLGFLFANYLRRRFGEAIDAGAIVRGMIPISAVERQRYAVDTGYFVQVVFSAREKEGPSREHLMGFQKGRNVYLFDFVSQAEAFDPEDPDTPISTFSKSFTTSATAPVASPVNKP